MCLNCLCQPRGQAQNRITRKDGQPLDGAFSYARFPIGGSATAVSEHLPRNPVRCRKLPRICSSSLLRLVRQTSMVERCLKIRLLLAFALLAPAQNNGAVEGVVANSVTHVGIAGVRVEVAELSGTAHFGTTTDRDGTFRVFGLAPSRYKAEFRHERFFDPQSNETAAVNFTVTGTGDTVRVRAELMPFATVRGRILDQNGNPMRGIRVALLHTRYLGTNTTETDAEGRFSIEDARPTAYVVAAEPPWGGNAPDDPPAENEEKWEWTRTWYPGVVDPRQAGQIVVPAGGELNGLEFRLKTARLYRIRGRVVDDEGKPVNGVMLQLHAEDPLDIGIEHSGMHSGMYTTSERDGRFEFSGVPSGSWRVVAERNPRQFMMVSEKIEAQGTKAEQLPGGIITLDHATPPGSGTPARGPADGTQLQPVEPNIEAVLRAIESYESAALSGQNHPDTGKEEWTIRPAGVAAKNGKMLERTAKDWQRGVKRLEVKHDDLDGVEVRLSPPFRVELKAVREDAPGGEAKPWEGSVTLFGGFAGEESVRGSAKDGVIEVFTGRYKVQSDDRSGYYMATARLGGRDVLGQEIELGPGAQALNLIFRPKSGSVSGMVAGSDHATVVLLPCDERLRDLDKIATAATQSEGRFEANGLRPETYYAWAFERLDLEALQDSMFVRSLATHAVTVRVNQGERATVSLSVTPWPE